MKEDVITSHASIGLIDTVHASPYRGEGYLVVRQVHHAEFRGWLQDRYAEYGRTSTFFR